MLTNVRRPTALVLLVCLVLPLSLGTVEALTASGADRGGPAAGGAGPAVSTGAVPVVSTGDGSAGSTMGAPGSTTGAAPTGQEPVPVVAPIGPNAQLNLSAADIELLAHIINAEARGEPFVGQVAVGAVVLNRVRAGGQFGRSVAEVIYQPGQFEPVRNGQIDLPPTPSSYQAARAAAQGQDPTGGALYFWDPAKTSSAFLWSRPFKVQIGGHRFTE